MVYWTKDGVTKAIDASHYPNGPQGLIDKIILHNSLFPETAYETVGFGKDRGGSFRVIVKQKFVAGKPASTESINNFAKNSGFEKKQGWYYTKDGKRISDLNSKNVVETSDGNLAVIDCDVEFTSEHLQQPRPVNIDIHTISDNSASYGVTIDSGFKNSWQSWQQSNPDGIVAYRVNYNKYNTPEEARAGRIGNPFSEGSNGVNKGIDTVQKFYDWLVTGDNFNEPKATEEYRQAIIDKLLSTDKPNILYYKELGYPSHATVLGYLINNKELLKSNTKPSQVKDQKAEKSSHSIPTHRPPQEHGHRSPRQEGYGGVPQEL